MIEKFSNEELEQIKRELGFYDKRIKVKNHENHIEKIREVLNGKPFSTQAMYEENYHNIFLVYSLYCFVLYE